MADKEAKRVRFTDVVETKMIDTTDGRGALAPPNTDDVAQKASKMMQEIMGNRSSST